MCKCRWGLGHSFLPPSEIRSHSYSLSGSPARDPGLGTLPPPPPFPRWVSYEQGMLNGSLLDFLGRRISGSEGPDSAGQTCAQHSWSRALRHSSSMLWKKKICALLSKRHRGRYWEATSHLPSLGSDLHSSSHWPRDGHLSLTPLCPPARVTGL